VCLKANHVFDYLSVTRYYNGLVLFLEDDHYVVSDLIPVVHQMYRLRPRYLFITPLHYSVLLLLLLLLVIFFLNRFCQMQLGSKVSGQMCQQCRLSGRQCPWLAGGDSVG